MTSLLAVKKSGGSMEVHNTSIADELRLKSDTSCVTILGSRQRKKAGRLSGRSMDGGSAQDSARMQEWLSKKIVKSLQVLKKSYHRKLEPFKNVRNNPLSVNMYLIAFLKDLSKEKERSDEESRAARVLYSPLLETEHTFVKDLDEFLSHEDMLKQRKKELLHKQWNDHVFEPIRRQILKVIDGQDWPEVDRRKRELHRQYLEYINRKGFAFLETMDKGEYYAQALNAHRPSPIKILIPALRDPLLSQGRARSEEEQTILRCMTGSIYTQKDINQVKLPPMPLVPLGRHGTDSMQWLRMPLGNIDSTPRMASRLRMKGNCTSTQVDFEKWGNLPVDPHIIDVELMTQKKRMFQEKPPYGIPAREVPQVPFLWFDTDHGEEVYIES